MIDRSSRSHSTPPRQLIQHGPEIGAPRGVEDRPGRLQVYHRLRQIAGMETRAKDFLHCYQWKGDRQSAGRARREQWRCRCFRCFDCAELDAKVLRDQYCHLVIDTATQIRAEDRSRSREYRHIILTTPRPSEADLRDLERARYRVRIATLAFQRFRDRVDWFRDAPKPAQRPRSSKQRIPHPRSSRRDSFAVAGWHGGKGWPHLHLLVFGAGYISKMQVQRAWWEAYRDAFEEVRRQWERDREAGRSGHRYFSRYRAARKVIIKGQGRTWSKIDIARVLQYLLEQGATDEEMLRDPDLTAIVIASWYNEPRYKPYGRLWGQAP